MTNTQFYLALGIPFLTILAVWIGGIISNRSVINDLRSEMRGAVTDLRADMSRRFDALESKLDRLGLCAHPLIEFPAGACKRVF